MAPCQHMWHLAGMKVLDGFPPSEAFALLHNAKAVLFQRCKSCGSVQALRIYGNHSIHGSMAEALKFYQEVPR